MGWLGGIVSAVRARLSRHRRQAPPPGQASSVDEVIATMRARGVTLAPADGVRHFHEMYLRVTEVVRDRIASGYFENAEFLARLDIVFAEMYLAQLASAAPNPAWAPLFASRRLPDRVSIQFALAGMNAHINHDLPTAVVRTCRQLALHPGSPGVHADYQRVTAVLGSVQEEVRQSFLRGVALETDRWLAGVANLVGTWSIARARDAAWTNAEVLWELDGSPLQDEYTGSLARSVGMVSRYLLTPPSDL